MSGLKALTTKQAKASYKARNCPSISETEKRWLQRAAELEQRAARRREQDSRRAEAAKRKSEKIQHQKLQGETVQLGTQRCLDRFGHQSSQFHLDQFFGRSAAPDPLTAGAEPAAERQYYFEHSQVSDAALLETFERPMLPPLRVQSNQIESANRSSSHDQRILLFSGTKERVPDVGVDDPSEFWNDIDSSTQVACELDTGSNAREAARDQKRSFSCESLDFTLEDIWELDNLSQHGPRVPCEARRATSEGTGEVLPSRLPLKTEVLTTLQSPPPHLRAFAVTTTNVVSTNVNGDNRTITHPPCASAPHARMKQPTPQPKVASGQRSAEHYLDLGFTATQLEAFVDDNLQLSQTASG